MRRLRMVLLALAALTVASLTVVPASAGAGTNGDRRPMIFVHGYFGSGAQFETQAKRFTSNGYPPGHVVLHEYDTSFGVEAEEQVLARLDDRIAELLDETGADRVDLLGHSLGTRLMQTYLRSSPERAARVAHYVNLDGMPGADPPGGVETLAVWGRGDPSREIVGAQNVRFDDQTHTQVVTSPETFGAIYEFFTGEAPETTKMRPQRRIELAGRAVLFPQNVGVDGGELEVYEVAPDTGERVGGEPVETFTLSDDGSWGPFTANGKERYEFAIVREGAAVHHLYYEPFVRSDHWVRLLTSPVEGGIGTLINTGDDHAALVFVRYKEWWGDQGDDSDVLAINGENILNAANSPIDKRAIALFAFDDGDGATNLDTPLPAFAELPFIAGVDVMIPASDPPDGTIEVLSTPRGGGGRQVSLNVPDFASTNDRVSIQLSDHLQGAKRPSP